MANPTAVYSYKGQEPQPLPHKIRLSSGKSRTDVSTFTDEEIADAGFTGPYTIPEYNSEMQKLVWSEENLTWIVEDKPEDLFHSFLREIRNEELLKSDWTQLSDVFHDNAELKNNWKQYRNFLRDLPQNIVDLNDISNKEKVFNIIKEEKKLFNLI